jgi:hypothetical protein
MRPAGWKKQQSMNKGITRSDFRAERDLIMTVSSASPRGKVRSG